MILIIVISILITGIISGIIVFTIKYINNRPTSTTSTSNNNGQPLTTKKPDSTKKPDCNKTLEEFKDDLVRLINEKRKIKVLKDGLQNIREELL